MSLPLRVLLVDDEPLLLETLERIFAREGMSVTTATSAAEALAAVERAPFDVALVDIVMPEMDGVAFLRQVRERPDPPEVVMLTAHATVDTAVEAMKLGAYDYLRKPADVGDVERVLRKAAERRRLRAENRRLRHLLRRHDPHGELVGDSAPMRELAALVDKVAPTDATVLVLGESGVGKELVARRLHAASRRADAPFLSVNCGALRASLLENELFGHVAGAFTGATKTTRGLFEEADGGTLFIDEIGEMAPEIQASLLQVLETGQFKRLGEARMRTTDVRVVAATNRDLARDVERGAFRQDLYYRLDVVSIRVPPLREHKEDVPALAEYFLRRLEPERDPPRRLSDAALARMMEHGWPGNVRELRNALERGVILGRGDEIGPADLPVLEAAPARKTPRATDGPAPPPPPGDADGGTLVTLAELERRQIERALAATEGNKTAAAKLLGVSLRSLYTRLRRHGLAANDDAPDR